MPSPALEQFIYESSPFFLSVDEKCLNAIFQRIDEQKLPVTYIICAELNNNATEIHTQRLLNLLPELRERHKTTNKDIDCYFLGLNAPLLLSKLTYFTLVNREDMVRDAVKGIGSINAQYAQYAQYLLGLLGVSVHMMQETKDIRSLIYIVQQQPFDNTPYFRLGVEACSKVLLEYLVAVVDKQVQQRFSRSSNEQDELSSK